MRLALPALLLLLTGCSSLATKAAADALSGSGGVYGRDDDPELVEAAVPFALKTMEALAVEQPEHVGLMVALSSGFTQYAYAFIAQDAHRIEPDDYDKAEELVARTHKLYERARDYAIRGLAIRQDLTPEQLQQKLQDDPEAIAAKFEKDDIPVLYWAAASWGLMVGSANLDPSAIADVPALQALARRAFALDPDWNEGALHELMMSFETSLPGGDLARAEKHYHRAVQLSEGRRVGTFVGYAEGIAVKRQQGAMFKAALERALEVDMEAFPEGRLANVVMKRRARRLLERQEDLILEDVVETSSTAARLDLKSRGTL